MTGLVGFVAATLGISHLFWDQHENPVLLAIFGFLEYVQRARDLLNGILPGFPPWVPVLQGWGDGFILVVGVIVLTVLFYEREDRVTQWVADVRRRLHQMAAAPASHSPTPATTASPAPQRTASTALLFSQAEIVNAPLDSVWDAIRATNCGPTCAELLDAVRVTWERKEVLRWEGTVQLAHDAFPVRGTTRLRAPVTMEVACTSGVLQGFKGSFHLEDLGGFTRVTQRATFDFARLAPEFADAAPDLSDLVPRVLEASMARLRTLDQAPEPPQPEDVEDAVSGNAT